MSQTEVLLVARRFRVVRHVVAARDGSLQAREIIEHPGSVTILPILDDGRVCLIRNFRISVGQSLVELPAGTLEPDEDPRLAAERELIEETGFHPRSCGLLCDFYLSPGILNERMQLYLATGLEAGKTQLEPGEEIEPLIVDWAEAMRMVMDGRIQDAKSLTGLLYYDRWRTA